jgi:hypothetical protein
MTEPWALLPRAELDALIPRVTLTKADDQPYEGCSRTTKYALPKPRKPIRETTRPVQPAEDPR